MAINFSLHLLAQKLKLVLNITGCFMLNLIWDALNEKKHIRYSTENSISDYRKIINLVKNGGEELCVTGHVRYVIPLDPWSQERAIPPACALTPSHRHHPKDLPPQLIPLSCITNCPLYWIITIRS